MDIEKKSSSILHPYFLATKSPLFQKTLKLCQKVAESNVNVLLSGDSGTGKEVLAHYIHAYSKRNKNNFIAVNCSAFSETLLESELFGHEQGAFTGATSSKKGKFELADKGTMFLDEVGDVSLQTQLKLLRVIETKQMERIGSNVSKSIDFRLISATHQNLEAAIQQGNFREDFFYRISTIVIQAPSLRQRMEDLDDLILFFLKKSSEENNKLIRKIDDCVMEFLYQYDYPGNIRELKNIIDRMVVLSENGVITKDGLPVMFSIRSAMKNAADTDQSAACYHEIIPFQEFKRQSEKAYLEWVLAQVGGNVAEASRRLKMSSRQLFNKINELGIRR